MELRGLLGCLVLRDQLVLLVLRENRVSMELEAYLTYLVCISFDKLQRDNSILNPEWIHPNGNKGDQFKFQIDCSSNCRGLYMEINSHDGDVDMYGKEGAFPTIS